MGLIGENDAPSESPENEVLSSRSTIQKGLELGRTAYEKVSDSLGTAAGSFQNWLKKREELWRGFVSPTWNYQTGLYLNGIWWLCTGGWMSSHLMMASLLGNYKIFNEMNFVGISVFFIGPRVFYWLIPSKIAFAAGSAGSTWLAYWWHLGSAPNKLETGSMPATW